MILHLTFLLFSEFNSFVASSLATFHGWREPLSQIQRRDAAVELAVQRALESNAEIERFSATQHLTATRGPSVHSYTFRGRPQAQSTCIAWLNVFKTAINNQSINCSERFLDHN